MALPIRVLIVEDRPSDAELMVHELERAGFEPSWQKVEQEQDYLAQLETAPDIILADHTLPQFNASRALDLLKQSGLGIPLIVVTGSISEEVAVERMKQGAADYILKDRMTRLGPAVKRALEDKRLRDQKLEADAERKRAEEKIEAHNRELETLNQIGQRLLNNLNLKEIAEETLDKTMGVGRFDLGVIEIVDSQLNVLKAVAARGYRNAGTLESRPTNRVDPGAGRPVRRLRTFQEVKPRVDEDLMQTEHMRHFKKEGIRSVVTVPMIVADQAIGIFRLGNRTLRKFTPEEINLFQAIANQTGIAIQKARLYEETQKNLARIQALHEIDKAIASTLNLKNVLEVLLEKVELFCPTSVATGVRLLDKTSGELIPFAARNIPLEEWKTELSKAKGLLSKQWGESRAPLLIPNMFKDSRTRLHDFSRKHGLVSYLALPLIAKDEFIGALIIYTREEHQFSKEEIESINTLADQGAIAIHNAQLYEETVRVNRVKDEFLSVMSHELRTPLTVVMGYTGMIRDGMLGEINPKQQEALEKVIGRANDQLAMVNNILHATVLETKKIAVDSHVVVLGEFLSQLKSDYDIPLHKDVTMNWECLSPLSIFHTDSAKLTQILRNIIDNAIKFTEKGSVTITADIRQEAEGKRQESQNLTPGDTQASRLSPHALEKWVEFKVTDTGIGIFERDLPFIFEKFHQVDSSETRPFGGVGIGLHVAKGFTELLGGTIEAESELGKGSTFTVRIPA